MFKRQILNYVLLALLLAGVFTLVNDSLLAGQFIGLDTRSWFIIAITVPILHQLYVWFTWRAELHHALISRWFGKGPGYHYYKVGFSILIIARPLSIIALALANRGSLNLDPFIAWLLAVVLLVPSLYLGYSVARYFGLERAYGIDHFDESYRNLPFVKQGIYRFTNNGMYLFGLLILWIPGLLLFSKAALLAALFNHLYVWVHYYCTELPDIHYIYGPGKAGM